MTTLDGGPRGFRPVEFKGWVPLFLLPILFLCLMSEAPLAHGYYAHAAFSKPKVPSAVNGPLDLAPPRPFAFPPPPSCLPGIGFPFERPRIRKCKIPGLGVPRCKIPGLGVTKCKVPGSVVSKCGIPAMPRFDFVPRCPLQPALTTGFDYTSSTSGSSSSLVADYFYPVDSSPCRVLFVETRLSQTAFWGQDPLWDRDALAGSNLDPTDYASDRVDFSVGAGWRGLLPSGFIVGANAFLDSFGLDSTWYASLGGGAEVTVLTLTDLTCDLRFNAYENLFNRQALASSFAHVGPSYELEGGVSSPVWCGSWDLRLKLGGYWFDIGKTVSGLRTGIEMRRWDGIFTVGWEHGYDQFHGHYDVFRGFFNARFNWRNLSTCLPSFGPPEFVLAGRRNLRNLLSRPVDRK